MEILSPIKIAQGAGNEKKLQSDASGNASWQDVAYRWSHTFGIMGAIAVASGDTDYIPPFFVPVMSNTTVVLASVRHRINSGTSVTYKLQKNGADITGFTALSATTTAAVVDPADVALADGDMLALVVTAVSGSPKNLTVSLILEAVV